MLTQDARAVARRGQPELRTQDRPGGEEVRREAMIARAEGKKGGGEGLFQKFRGGWQRGEEKTREKEGPPGRGELGESARERTGRALAAGLSLCR